MQFIRNIIIADSDKAYTKEIKKSLRSASKKLEVNTCADKTDFTKIFQGDIQEISTIFVNTNLGTPSCLYILRMINMTQTKTEKKINVIFGGEDFEVFGEVVKQSPISDLNIINFPFTCPELAERILQLTFGEKVTLKNHEETQKKAKYGVDLEFINVFIQSSKKVIQELAMIEEIKHSSPFLMNRGNDDPPLDVVSKIILSSDYFKGSFFIIFSTKTFLDLYERVVYEKYEEVNEENIDFAAEFANIVYGQAKKIFAQSGYNLDMAIPGLHEENTITADTVIAIPIECELGTIHLAVAPNHL